MALDVLFNIIFFVIIFCFLTYSCQWFGRTLKRYQEARREFEDQELARQNTGDNRFSVYTVEHGRRTPRIPANIVVKEDFPPTYDDALQMPQPYPLSHVLPSFSESSVVASQRRNSSIL